MTWIKAADAPDGKYLGHWPYRDAAGRVYHPVENNTEGRRQVDHKARASPALRVACGVLEAARDQPVPATAAAA